MTLFPKPMPGSKIIWLSSNPILLANFIFTSKYLNNSLDGILNFLNTIKHTQFSEIFGDNVDMHD